MQYLHFHDMCYCVGQVHSNVMRNAFDLGPSPQTMYGKIGSTVITPPLYTECMSTCQCAIPFTTLLTGSTDCIKVNVVLLETGNSNTTWYVVEWNYREWRSNQDSREL